MTLNKPFDHETEAKLEPGGPINITGDVIVYDEQGKYVRHTDFTKLCRCGHSKTKPYCDGSHLNKEFIDFDGMHEVSDFAHENFHSSVRIQCQEDGPLRFNGTLTIKNSRGQSCTKVRGFLCRCGQSGNKPFCDGSHKRVGFSTEKDK